MSVCLASSSAPAVSRCTRRGAARSCSQACHAASWPGYKARCRPTPPPLTAADLAAAAAAHHGVPEHEDLFLADAEVQAKVLTALGWRADGSVLGQRPLADGELWEAVTKSKKGLARLLFGRNSFQHSYLPLLRTLSQDTRWPTMLSARDQGHVTELPTLELCSALATRVLCVARRLERQGKKRLIFLGIGSGDALVEASIALHVAAALGLPIELQGGSPPRLRAGGVDIDFVATDTAELATRQRNRTLQAPAEMTVLDFDRREAVRHFAEEAPLYVFCSWMPMRAARWRADAEEDGSGRLCELCFLTSPPTLIKVHDLELKSKLRMTVELFPRTLCRWDFLARGCDGGEEAGLYHSQLYIFPEPRAAPPFLPEILSHGKGDYVSRMARSEELQGINYCRGLGLYNVCGPRDFEEEVPELYMYSLRESSLAQQMAVDSESLQAQLVDCLHFLKGRAAKQIGALLKELQRRSRR